MTMQEREFTLHSSLSAGWEILRLRLRMTITHRFVILNRKAVKNLRPFLLRAGEDTRPYERNGLCLRVGEGISALLRLRAIRGSPL